MLLHYITGISYMCFLLGGVLWFSSAKSNENIYYNLNTKIINKRIIFCKNHYSLPLSYSNHILSICGHQDCTKIQLDSTTLNECFWIIEWFSQKLMYTHIIFHLNWITVDTVLVKWNIWLQIDLQRNLYIFNCEIVVFLEISKFVFPLINIVKFWEVKIVASVIGQLNSFTKSDYLKSTGILLEWFSQYQILMIQWYPFIFFAWKTGILCEFSGFLLSLVSVSFSITKYKY